jgi:predicted component of type VI protein secretion system
VQQLDDDGVPLAAIEVGNDLTIGRALDNRVVLPTDELASRHHARIQRDDGAFVIRDLDSSNGIRIWRDGAWHTVEQQEPLEEHDITVIGSNAFRFSMGSEVGA